MTTSFDVVFQNEMTLFNQFLDNWIEKYEKSIPNSNHQLIDAFKYFLAGGKRFRPLLVILTAKAFRQNVECVLPYACAVELLHNYSLIHDDLPAMDSAEKRRGRLSLHKAFNEATAILTGDAMLTEAFALAVSHKPKNMKDTSLLVQLLVQAAGGKGMITGQMLDLQAVDLQAVDLQAVDLQAVDLQAVDLQAVDPQAVDLQAADLQAADLQAADPQVVDLQIANNKSINLEQLYDLKTGQLISASIIGSAILSGAKKSDILKLKGFAQKSGIAFQIADDLEDFREQGDDKSIINCVHEWGVQAAQKRLCELFNQSLNILKSIENTEYLQKLMQLHFAKYL